MNQAESEELEAYRKWAEDGRQLMRQAVEIHDAGKAMVASLEEKNALQERKLNELRVKVERLESTLAVEQAQHRRTKRDLNMMLNYPPLWKRLLTRWRKPTLQTTACDYCDGTGREIPLF